LEFGKTATLAIHEGFSQAQKELAVTGRPVLLNHSALSHSWGTVLKTEAVEFAHSQFGLRLFTGDLSYIAPRVSQSRIAGLGQIGYNPAQISVTVIKGDAWALPAVSAANIRAARRGAGVDYNLHIIEPPVARGLPWDTQNTQHNLPITNPRLNMQVETYALGYRSQFRTDVVNLLTTYRPTASSASSTPPGGVCLGGKQAYRVTPDLEQELDRLEKTSIE
jgi:hypothetical protein